MKILVVSDTHGSIDRVIDYIGQENDIDLLIHLGDYSEDGLVLEEETQIKTVIIAGNGDLHTNYDEEMIMTIEGHKFFLSHGHKYNISYGLDQIYYRTLELGCDIVLFGHSHSPIDYEDDIIFFNPGSPSFPRGVNKYPSVGILIIDEEGIKREIIKL